MTADTLSHVLYVDDDPDMRMLVQLTLENMGGIKVTVCETAVGVLESALDTHPQMILLDAVMPGMDGPSILRALQADNRLSDIPVAFLTGRAQQADIDNFMAMGAVGVLAKPFDLITLSDEVVSLWKKSQPSVS